MKCLSSHLLVSVYLAGGLCLLITTWLPAQAAEWRESANQAPSTDVKTALIDTEALSEAERLRSERRANAHELVFVLPYFEANRHSDTKVVLMNTVSDPISVFLTARNHLGNELALGTWVLESLSHQEISLRDHLTGYQGEFATGYLTVSLLGDKDTLQGWGIVQNRKGTFEIPLTTKEEVSASSFLAHWDTLTASTESKDRPRFVLINASDHQVAVQLTAGGHGRKEHRVIQLGPEESIWVDTVESHPLESQSWARFSHDGEPGDLLVLGLHGGRTPSGVIPISAASAVQASKRYESIPLPPRHRCSTRG